jgi:uncharacterized protein YraI
MQHRHLPAQKGDVTMKSRLFIGLLLLTFLVAACAPAEVPPSPPPVVTEEPIIPVTGVAVVQSVDLQILGTQPIQVNALVRGQLPDGGCTTISGIDQTHDDNTIKVTLTTTTDPLALCAQALTPFEQVIALDVANLPPAEYTVDVNGVTQTFELLTRDGMQFKQALVSALNARDYDLLKLMMDESLIIGYWRSEGTSNTHDQAIEQLRLNLLNSSSPITADYTKNLIELLGEDPVTIAGSEVVEASAVFVSGLGAQGKDEAILFVAKLPDGGLYWHGLLFAMDGFARPAAPVTPVVVQPVNMNAYPTDVKFILAQKDVRMRSGPGTQFSIIGLIAAGQTVKVTGVNVNGSWWRVICPDDKVGSCWVSADRSLTKPTDGIVTNPPPADTTKKADVQSVEIQILESYPLQVNVLARGLLPDSGCTSITNVSQSRNGNVFTVVVLTKTSQQTVCAQMLTPFEQVIPLDVSSLLPGTYIVHVNGVEASFVLPEAYQPTSVQFVMALQDVSIFNGPGTQYSPIGSIASGQTAKVTGVSASGNWWRVICPDNTSASCWVSANPADTLPTQ